MKPSRFILLWVVCLIGVSLLGCRRETDVNPEQLDRQSRRIQLLTDAFSALNKQQHELAITRLEKLEESQCANNLVRLEQQNIAIDTVSARLAEGDLVGAEVALNEVIVRTGSTPQIIRTRNQIQGLARIREYKRLLPFDEAERAAEEVARLAKPEVFDNNISYGKWLGTQHRMLQQLIRTERLRVTAEILNELDLALVKGQDSNIQNLYAQLRVVNPNHPLSAAVLAPPESTKDIDPTTFDLICFIQARYRGTKRHAKVLSLYQNRKPASLCGEYLKADAAIAAGDMTGALLRLREIETFAGGMDSSRLRVPLNRMINRVSVKATPSLPSILEVLYQLQTPHSE